MTLDEFKTIFWWEWAHRILARGVGFVFALPLVFFWATGASSADWRPKLVGILALGGLQGAIGWWMVSSGLVDRVDVSQYRLATHLTIACDHLRRNRWSWRAGLRRIREPPADREYTARGRHPGDRWRWSRSISAGWSRASMPGSATTPGR